MSATKLLFFDIDGTLLTEDSHIVPKSTILALKKAKQKGHRIFINTGRPISTIDTIIKDINPDGYICGCGTYIQYKNDILFHRILTKERCQELKQLVRETNIDPIFEGKNTVYFDSTPVHPFIQQLKERYQALQFPIGNFDDRDFIFDKFAVWYNKNSDILTFKEKIPDFDYIHRGDDFAELVPSGCSKATGIDFLANHFNVSLDDCYVFGDSSNDEAMLKHVKHSIVMGNGEPYLFDYAYYVTKHIDEDGIHHALSHLQLI